MIQVIIIKRYINSGIERENLIITIIIIAKGILLFRHCGIFVFGLLFLFRVKSSKRSPPTISTNCVYLRKGYKLLITIAKVGVKHEKIYN